MRKIYIMITCCMSLAFFGCSTHSNTYQDGSGGGGGGGKEEPRTGEEARYLPFRIAYDVAIKQFVILDGDGREVPLEKVELPMETSQLYSVETISIIFIEGSCKMLVSDGKGGWEAKTYPDVVCRALGIQ